MPTSCGRSQIARWICVAYLPALKKKSSEVVSCHVAVRASLEGAEEGEGRGKDEGYARCLGLRERCRVGETTTRLRTATYNSVSVSRKHCGGGGGKVAMPLRPPPPTTKFGVGLRRQPVLAPAVGWAGWVIVP